MDYKKLYEENSEFHQFVDKCANTDCKSVEETLQKVIVRNVGDYYIEKGEGTVSTTELKAGCGGAC
jgi:hypothetical protein